MFRKLKKRVQRRPETRITIERRKKYTVKELDFNDFAVYEAMTGYLVGDVSRWNNGKFAELKDRVKHG